MNNKKLTAIENIVAATATYSKALMNVEEVIKFADIEKTCELLDIKEFLTNIQLIRAIINLNNNNDGGDDDEDVGVIPVATVVNTTQEITEKADENSREDIDLTCDFISYDKPHVVKHDRRVLNLMGKVYKTVRVSALDHLLLVREDGEIFDYLGNQIVVSTYINGNGNKIKLTMPNGKLTHMSAIPIIADAWVEKKRKGDIYPRIVDTQKPVTPDNIIWYDRKLGPVKVPPEYHVSTTPQSTTNWKYRHESDDKTADTAETTTKKPATSIAYSIEYEIPVIRQLNRYRGSIKKVYDELKDNGSAVTLFDIFNIKENKFGTTDDDLSVLVRDVVEECQYDMNRIGDLILKNTNKIISHTQRRLIRKLAKKAGVDVVEETEKFPEVKIAEQKNERELEIANVLKRLDWNILSVFLHMRATPVPATMFQIYKVKEKYYSTDESDIRAVAINIHRSMGISNYTKISDMIDNELGVTVNPEKIEQWIDNYNSYIQRKKGEAASAK